MGVGSFGVFFFIFRREGVKNKRFFLSFAGVAPPARICGIDDIGSFSLLVGVVVGAFGGRVVTSVECEVESVVNAVVEPTSCINRLVEEESFGSWICEGYCFCWDAAGSSFVAGISGISIPSGEPKP